MHQIEQCLLNPRAPGDGETQRIKKVFVISPFDLSDATIASINGHLRVTNAVEFVCGTRLFDRFREHWPDFLVDEFLTVREHIRRTKLALEHEGALENLSLNYQLSKPDKSISRYYVYPDLTQTFMPLALGTTVISALEKADRLRQQNDAKISQREIEELETTHAALDGIATRLSRWMDKSDEVERLGRSYEAYRSTISALWFARAALVNRKDKNSSMLPPVEITTEEKGRLTAQLQRCKAEKKALLVTLERGLSATLRITSTSDNSPSILAHPDYSAALQFTDMHREAPDTLCTSTGNERTITFPSTALDAVTTSILIAGPAGYGKTSFCRWHALRDAERFTNASSEVIPAYFPLYEIGKVPLKTFEELFLENVGQSALLPADTNTNQYIQSRRIRLYLDGLDEMPSREKRAELIAILRSGLTKWPNVQVILTARDYVVEPSFAWLPRIQLAPFTSDNIRSLASQWFDGDAMKVHAFVGQATRIPELKKIMGVPLIATLVILLFRHTNNLPANRTKLFSMFVDLLSEGWDLAKGVRRATQFGSHVKQAVLRKVAHQAHCKRTKSIRQDDLLATANKILKTGNDDKHNLLVELAQDGVISATGTDYRFTHLSFQEFLTARHLIGDPTGRLATAALTEFLKGEQWWKEVLCHYAGLSADAHELDAWLTLQIRSAAIKDERLAKEQANVLRRELSWILPGLK